MTYNVFSGTLNPTHLRFFSALTPLVQSVRPVKIPEILFWRDLAQPGCTPGRPGWSSDRDPQS